MLRAVHLHRHDVLTVPLIVLFQCPITSMTHTVLLVLVPVLTNHVQESCDSFDYSLKLYN